MVLMYRKDKELLRRVQGTYTCLALLYDVASPAGFRRWEASLITQCPICLQHYELGPSMDSYIPTRMGSQAFQIHIRPHLRHKGPIVRAASTGVLSWPLKQVAGFRKRLQHRAELRQFPPETLSRDTVPEVKIQQEAQIDNTQK